MPTTAKSSTFPQIKAVANFINSHYELYGRKLTLVPFTSMTSGQDVDHASNPSYEHADAVSAAALKPFAATEFVDRNDYVAVMPEYVDYLADHHVVTTFGSNQTTGIEESSMREHAPYQWSYTSTLTDSLVSLAGLACRTLKGKPAIHAKGGLQTKTRKFGIVLPDQHMMGQPLTGFNRFISALAGCGLSDLPIYYDTKDARQATNAANMADAKNKGITTLLWFQWSSSTDDPQAMADQARYSPEWVAVSRNFWWSASWALLGNNQTGNTMGISPFSKLLIDSQQFWMQAYQAGGGPLPPPGQIDGAAPLYRDLQLLASGIQMAGPRLTPETLAAALHGIDYPNPGAGAAPYYQARVGFQGGSPVMTHDFVAYWPDPSGTKSQFLVDNTYNNPYEFYCWVNDGARYTADTWPAEDRFHKGRCR